MISLFDQNPFQSDSEEDLRKKLVKSAKARNILEFEDFRWWVENVLDKRTDTQIAALVWKDEEPKEYHKRRGLIQGISKVLQELRKDASNVEDLERKLQDYDERKHPVARGA